MFKGPSSADSASAGASYDASFYEQYYAYGGGGGVGAGYAPAVSLAPYGAPHTPQRSSNGNVGAGAIANGANGATAYLQHKTPAVNQVMPPPNAVYVPGLTASSKGTYVDPTKYKTRICRNHQPGSPCPFGARCQFAHSNEELRAPNSTDLAVVSEMARMPRATPGGGLDGRRGSTDTLGSSQPLSAPVSPDAGAAAHSRYSHDSDVDIGSAGTLAKIDSGEHVAVMASSTPVGAAAAAGGVVSVGGIPASQRFAPPPLPPSLVSPAQQQQQHHQSSSNDSLDNIAGNRIGNIPPVAPPSYDDSVSKPRADAVAVRAIPTARRHRQHQQQHHHEHDQHDAAAASSRYIWNPYSTTNAVLNCTQH